MDNPSFWWRRISHEENCAELPSLLFYKRGQRKKVNHRSVPTVRRLALRFCIITAYWSAIMLAKHFEQRTNAWHSEWFMWHLHIYLDWTTLALFAAELIFEGAFFVTVASKFVPNKPLHSEIASVQKVCSYRSVMKREESCASESMILLVVSNIPTERLEVWQNCCGAKNTVEIYHCFYPNNVFCVWAHKLISQWFASSMRVYFDHLGNGYGQELMIMVPHYKVVI